MDKLTFLEYKQLYFSGKLDFIDKIGILSPITDFSILLGGWFSDNYFTSERNDLKHRAGRYWTKTEYNLGEAYAVSYADIIYFFKVSDRKIGGRPVLQYSLISDVISSKVRKSNGILEIEYGYYPQWAPPHDYQLELEYALKKGTITQLTDYITTDTIKWDEYDKEFEPQNHIIFEYKGKKYICVKANPYVTNFTLSNRKKYKRDDYVWIEISPVKWLVDEQADIAVSKNILFAGVQFKHNSNYDGDFSKTDINWFMNTYLINDLLKCNDIINNTKNPTREQLLEEIKILKKQLEEVNRRNSELEKENTSYKQRIRRIQDITKE